jgi:hypothetical protein
MFKLLSNWVSNPMEHRLLPFVVETQLVYYPLPQLPANGAANVLHRKYYAWLNHI